MSHQEGPNSTGILYQYQNQASKVEIVGGSVSDIANRISKDLEAKNEDMSVVLVGVDALWDVALMKFIYEFTSASYVSNLNDFKIVVFSTKPSSYRFFLPKFLYEIFRTSSLKYLAFIG